MQGGGNAVDAAIAANAVLGVVAPDTCGPGGDLFAIVYEPGHPTPTALNASGRAGSGATAVAVRAAGHEVIPLRGPWTVTVPGCVDGWEALADRHGDLPLAQVLQPAIDLATHGFPVSEELAASLHRIKGMIGGRPSAAALYPEGRPPRPGTVLRRTDLAATLRAIADGGRAAFYEGRVGTAISQATEGVLHPADLQRAQADWVEPISIDVMGHTGWTIPPNAQGYLALAAAWIFEQLDPPRDPADPGFAHTAVEAYRSVAWERDDLVSDPDFAPLPADRLLDPARLGRRVEGISPDRRATWPTPSPSPGGTAFMCVWDSSGMGISLIQSNFHGIGSGITAGDTGVFLHNRGAGFCLTPGHPNELAPGKRPLHTLSPTLWTRGADLAMLLGTRGGHFQPQTLLQMITAMLWSGRTGAEAQLLPRWTTQEWRSDGDAITYETRTDAAVVEGLAALGHTLRPGPAWAEGWGPVAVITAPGEQVRGFADPRVGSTAALS